MLVPELLLEALEDLGDDDFKHLKWYLSMQVLDGCKAIPKCRLEKACRIDTVSRLIESYSEESAVNVTVEILKKIRNNSLAESLKNKYAALKTATDSTAPPPAAPAAVPPAAVPPAAPASLSAQQGSVIIAPTLSGGTSGAWNITINNNCSSAPPGVSRGRWSHIDVAVTTSVPLFQTSSSHFTDAD